MTRQEIYDASKKYTLFTWAPQGGYDPIVVDKVDGVHFWDMDGKRYTDLSSQLVCVNTGFNKKEILDAVAEQLYKFPYVAPRHTYEKRAELGKVIIEEIAPKNMAKVLFGLGGADANEFAIRLAKVYTGRHKIFAKYQSYHGSTAGSGSLTGEADRSVPFAPLAGVIHFDAPHTYNYDIQFATEEEATAHFLARLEYQMKMENPKDIAALFIETVPGSNGVQIYPKGYLQGVRELCTKYGILMVCDEVMAGWGRTGHWFAFEAYGIEPDMITTAKGLSSAYAPLSATIVSKEISDFYEKTSLPAGLTYNAHALGVAAGLATIRYYQKYDLINRAKEMGKKFGQMLEDLKAKHACVGDVRYIGMFSAIELVKNKETRELLLEDENGKPIFGAVAANLKKRGFTTVGHDNTFMFAPALTVTEEELQEMVEGVDAMLSDFDHLAK